jgi:membrane associated rhomboid family serine protease
MGIVNEISRSFRRGSVVIRLIFINATVFILLGLVFVFIRLFSTGMPLAELRLYFDEHFIRYLAVPSLPSELLLRPWTMFTYMFTHFNLWHILFNMLVLYWFGKIFLQYLSAKQLLSNYILGGLSGALLYILFFNIFPGLKEYLGSSMLGASASIMAIVIAIAVFVPEYTLYMLFLGQVKLKYIALAFILLDILMIASDNAGGNIAHLGGALYGYLFITYLKKGRDIGNWLIVAFERTRRNRRLSVSYRRMSRKITDEEYNRNKALQQKEIDRILDKIAQGGYESLTKKEKETLFKMSNPSS